MTKKEYLESLGSLTEHLISQDISNEDIMGIILDFKIACEYSLQADNFNKPYISCMLTEILYNDDNFLVVNPWINQVFYSGQSIVFN